MPEFIPERDAGFGNEPTEDAYVNGGAIDEPSLAESYDSQDAHFAAVDKLSDQGVANYADAAAMKGYDPTEYELDDLFSQSETQSTPTQGVSVGLRERAEAVAELMDGIATRNRLSGAQRSGAVNRYSNPDRVMQGMENNVAFHNRRKDAAVEALAKTAALRAIGFTDAEAEVSKTIILRNLTGSHNTPKGRVSLQDTGKQAQALRNKQKTVTARTAKKVLGS